MARVLSVSLSCSPEASGAYLCEQDRALSYPPPGELARRGCDGIKVRHFSSFARRTLPQISFGLPTAFFGGPAVRSVLLISYHMLMSNPRRHCWKSGAA